MCVDICCKNKNWSAENISEIWNQLKVDLFFLRLFIEWGYFIQIINNTEYDGKNHGRLGRKRTNILKFCPLLPPGADQLAPFLETKPNWLEICVFPSAHFTYWHPCVFPFCMSLCLLATAIKTSRIILSYLHFKLSFNCWCEIKILEYCDF